MTIAAALLAGLRARGLRLRRDGPALLVRPRELLTAADRAALAVHKVAILGLLGAEIVNTPGGPCGLCGCALTRVEGWPAPGAVAWLCPHCAAEPVPTLAEVYAKLTDVERRQLAAEVAAGDALAIQMLGALMLVTCPSCGGDRWRADGPDGERCVACGAWSPCSRPNDAGGTEAR
jgi:hypothetical protein